MDVKRTAWRSYRFLLPIVLVTMAAAVRSFLVPVLIYAPYITFFPAITISALYGGVLPGFFATVLSALIVTEWWFGSGLVSLFAIPGGLPGLVAFLISNFIIVGVCAQLRNAQQLITVEAERLRQSEERLKRSQEIAHLGSWELDLVKNELTWSDEVYRIFGLEPQEFGATYEAFLEAVYPDDRAAVDEAYSSSIREGRDIYEIEHRVVRKGTGEVRTVHEKCRQVRDANGEIIRSVGMILDITERRRAEEALRLSEQRLRATFDNAGVGIVEVDAEDRFIAVNDRICEILGYPRDELLGMSVHELTFPEDRDRSDQMNAHLHKGDFERFDYEKRYLKRDGTPLWVHVTVSAVRDSERRHLRSIATVEDIAERKRAEKERERLLADIQRSNRELEQFAYVASHDLQEPLRMVASYVQLFEKKYKGQLDERADQYIHYAVDGARRMQKLIEGLLAYSRIARKGAELGPVDANHVFSTAVSNLSAAIEESHAVVTKDDLPTVSGDETQLVQLFQNLIANAIKFRKPGSIPLVHVSAKREGREWVFSVRDNGIGISPEFYDRIFLIFQRLHTRQEYPGTGIGLALCKRIMERHHGRIWVESVQGEGTAFFFAIPVK